MCRARPTLQRAERLAVPCENAMRRCPVKNALSSATRGSSARLTSVDYAPPGVANAHSHATTPRRAAVPSLPPPVSSHLHDTRRRRCLFQSTPPQPSSPSARHSWFLRAIPSLTRPAFPHPSVLFPPRSHLPAWLLVAGFAPFTFTLLRSLPSPPSPPPPPRTGWQHRDNVWLLR